MSGRPSDTRGDAGPDERLAPLARNLIYVAMSRAMDNLSVFALAAAAEKPLADLVTAFADRPTA